MRGDENEAFPPEATKTKPFLRKQVNARVYSTSFTSHSRIPITEVGEWA